MTVTLVRHASHSELGHVLSGRSEIALSAAGLAEARRLADRLNGVGVTRIQSSPRRRAAETAAIVAAPHDLPVDLIEALDEIDFGEWSGQTFLALDNDPAWRRWNAARGSAATPTGETMTTATARAMRHIESVGTHHLLCVTHCDIVRGIVAHCLGIPLDRLLSFDIHPASATTLELDHGGARVVAVNERAS